MEHNNHTYHLVPIAQKEIRFSKGFGSYDKDSNKVYSGVTSTDGQWIAGDKGDNEDCSSWIDFPEITDLPQYMQDYMNANDIIGCCFTHEQIKGLISIQANSKGASNGYSFEEKT